MARRAGIDVVLAPVVDVNSEPDNPVIGVRSFGAETGLVARHGAAFVRGVQAQGVAACAKHFPGHGATRTDSHVGLPVVDADRDDVSGAGRHAVRGGDRRRAFAASSPPMSPCRRSTRHRRR